jgi:hypothetical protein
MYHDRSRKSRELANLRKKLPLVGSVKVAKSRSYTLLSQQLYETRLPDGSRSAIFGPNLRVVLCGTSHPIILQKGDAVVQTKTRNTG